jgi:hypothetical protein
MAVLIRPKDIFVEFLRAGYKEPARSGLSKRHTNTASESSTPLNLATDVTVSNTKLLCINSVTRGGSAQTKWEHYTVDLTNNKIVFASAFDGATEVIIDYDYSTTGISWINPSNPERDTSSSLKRTDYPRITVSEIDFRGNVLGFQSDTQDNNVIFQVDVATKDKLQATDYVRIKTDGTSETISEVTMNTMLVDVLSHNMTNAAKRLWRTHIQNIMYPPANMVRGSTEVNIDQGSGMFRRVIDFQFKGFNLGERA